ncbi:Glycosyl hydrolases family 16 [Geosmithia morbida]|uniref:chitinase n=1 Tax=Geosmithia morbida TaxID=1094350 RepID=A0A9P4YU77_9HYPO|nr:Glycosyl hydrolases family 16 [Geosmithia morbida]KAF4122895.1 Glycosyl hydrolases family 16 [Geosmithia morbida]
MVWKSFLATAALLGAAFAQTTSDCNPYKGDDCDPNPAFGTEFRWPFNSTPDGQLWENQVGSIDYDAETGAKFTITKKGDSPTIRTKFYIFFGRVEFHLKASTGAGVVSSMMLLSDDLDEIDWEFIGNDPRATTNFYGKGIEDWTNGNYHDMDVAVQDEYHNYTIDWTKEKIDFYINEVLTRTIEASNCTLDNGTDVYPQTPMRISLGIWAGGDSSLNYWTRQWAGGDIDYSKGPYDMFVQNVFVEDYSSGKEYVWGDNSGSWESIDIVAGNSTAYKAIHKKEKVHKSLNQKFNELPTAGKIAIYAGGSAVAAVMIAALIFYCIKQRRRGASEARMALQQTEAERLDMERLQKQGVDPDSFTEQSTEYNPREMKGGGIIGSSSYNAVNSSASSIDTDRHWVSGATGAAVGAGAAAAAGGPHSPRSPSLSNFPSPNPSNNGFASPPPPFSSVRSPSPGMGRSSPGPQSVYGASRMQGGGPASPEQSNSPHRGYGY